MKRTVLLLILLSALLTTCRAVPPVGIEPEGAPIDLPSAEQIEGVAERLESDDPVVWHPAVAELLGLGDRVATYYDRTAAGPQTQIVAGAIRGKVNGFGPADVEAIEKLNSELWIDLPDPRDGKGAWRRAIAIRDRALKALLDRGDPAASLVGHYLLFVYSEAERGNRLFKVIHYGLQIDEAVDRAGEKGVLPLAYCLDAAYPVAARHALQMLNGRFATREISTERARYRLRRLAREASGDLQLKAAYHLAKYLKDRSAEKILVEAFLRSDDPRVLDTSMSALVALDKDKAADLLVKKLDTTEDHEQRMALAWFLGDTGSLKVLPTVKRILRSNNEELIKRVLAGMSRMPTPKLEKVLLEMMDRDYPQKGFPTFVYAHLGWIGSTKAVPELIERFNEAKLPPFSLVRALGDIGDRRAIGPLKKRLDHPDPVTRVTIATSLLHLGDTSGIPLLKKEMNETESLEARCDAAFARAQIGDPEAIDLLVKHLSLGKARMEKRQNYLYAMIPLRVLLGTAGEPLDRIIPRSRMSLHWQHWWARPENRSKLPWKIIEAQLLFLGSDITDRMHAIQALRLLTEETFPYLPSSPPEERAEQAKKWKTWWKKNSSKLVWDKAKHCLVVRTRHSDADRNSAQQAIDRIGTTE